MTNSLHAGEVLALAEIISACQDTAKVVRVNAEGELIHGHARHIVKSPDNCGFLNERDDIREGYLRVTSQSGWEHFWAISELLPELASGTFARYDW